MRSMLIALQTCIIMRLMRVRCFLYFFLLLTNCCIAFTYRLRTCARRPLRCTNRYRPFPPESSTIARLDRSFLWNCAFSFLSSLKIPIKIKLANEFSLLSYSRPSACQMRIYFFKKRKIVISEMAAANNSNLNRTGQFHFNIVFIASFCQIIPFTAMANLLFFFHSLVRVCSRSTRLVTRCDCTISIVAPPQNPLLNFITF